MKKYYVTPLSEDVFAGPLMDELDDMLGGVGIGSSTYEGGGL